MTRPSRVSEIFLLSGSREPVCYYLTVIFKVDLGDRVR